MKWNPYTDPFVEAGYFGYSLRGIARYIATGCFIARLEIRAPALGDELLYERTFAETFVNADEALRWATGKGHQIINTLLEHTDWAEPTDVVH